MRLNNYVVREIQEYLRSMNWAQREYKGELLTTFLRGVEYALMDKGIRLSLKTAKTASYETEFYVTVEQYEMAVDCWSPVKTIGTIRENSVKWEAQHND